MFFHLVHTRIKVLLQQKSMLFWTLIFPIALATFFFLAFSNLSSSENFEAPKVAVVGEEQAFMNYLTTLSSGDDQLFHLQPLSKVEAQKQLEENEIAGYFELTDPVSMTVKKNGVEQTLMKYVIDRYYQTASLASSIASNHPEAIAEGVLEELQKEPNYFVAQEKQNTDYTVIYFYTLIGMVCMYAGFFGIDAVCESEGNLSMRGARICISPTHKLKSLLASLLAGWLFQILELFILLLYLLLVLKIDFGSQLLYVILIMIVGSLAGITSGTFFGALSKKDKDHKISVFVNLSLLLSFLAGMMIVDLKYYIAEHAPIINQINPVSLITDGLYSLYYYTTQTRFWNNLIFLSLFSIVMILLSYFALRRKKYDSI